MKYLKKNYFFLIFFAFCLTLVLISNYRIDTISKNNKLAFQEKIKYCQEKIDDLDLEEREKCERFIGVGDIETRKEFYEKYDFMFSFEMSYFAILASLILITLSLQEVTKVFRDKVSLLMLKRENYFSFIKKIFLNAYKYIWFWPLIVLIIIFCALNNSYFDPITSTQNAIWPIALMNKPFLFFALYILNILLISGLYINIGLIIARYKHNYVVAVILSFLTVIAIELFFEIVVSGLFFGNLLHNYDAGLIFNIINLFVFNIAEANGVFNLLLFSFSCFFISFIIVCLCYKSKEKLVIDCEKNN